MDRIFIGYVSDKTEDEMKKSKEMKCFSRHNRNKVREGDIIVNVNTDKKAFVCVSVSSGSLVARSLLDPDVFTGKDQRYQKSEIPVKYQRWFARPLAMDEVARMCGIPPDSNAKSNIHKSTVMEYAEVFYNGEHREDILKTFHNLVLSWV